MLLAISVHRKQRDVLFIQFIENQGPLRVSSITRSSGYAAQTAEPPEDEQVMLETRRGS
jgi:hypothetical protein